MPSPITRLPLPGDHERRHPASISGTLHAATGQQGDPLAANK